MPTTQDGYEPYTGHLIPCNMCGTRKADFMGVPMLPFRYDNYLEAPPCIQCYLKLSEAKNQAEFDAMLPTMRHAASSKRRHNDPSEAEPTGEASEGFDDDWDS